MGAYGGNKRVHDLAHSSGVSYDSWLFVCLQFYGIFRKRRCRVISPKLSSFCVEQKPKPHIQKKKRFQISHVLLPLYYLLLFNYHK